MFINNKSKTLQERHFSPIQNEDRRNNSIKFDKNDVLASIMKKYTYRFLKSHDSIANENLSTAKIFQTKSKHLFILFNI